MAQHGRQNEGHIETPDFPVLMLSLRLCHGKSVIQVLLHVMCTASYVTVSAYLFAC